MSVEDVRGHDGGMSEADAEAEADADADAVTQR